METKLSAITGQTVFSSYSVDTAVTWAGMDGCVWHEKKKNQEGITLQASQFDNKNIAACKEKKTKKIIFAFLVIAAISPDFHALLNLYYLSSGDTVFTWRTQRGAPSEDDLICPALVKVNESAFNLQVAPFQWRSVEEVSHKW